MMRQLRVALVFLLSGVIAFGIWKYYTVNQNVYFQDPVSPLRERLTSSLQLEPQAEQVTTGEATSSGSFFARLFSGKYLPKFRDEQATSMHADFSTGRIPMAEVLNLKDQGVVAGATTGRVMIIEYCHIDSQYCQEASQEGVIDDYLAILPGNVQYTFRSFPPSLGRDALLPHIALACVADRGSQGQYLTYLQRLYTLADSSNQAALTNLADEINVDQFATCLEQNRYALMIRQQMKGADELFAINALPTYILLDRNTGRYIKIPGLYETEEVDVAVNTLLE